MKRLTLYFLFFLMLLLSTSCENNKTIVQNNSAQISTNTKRTETQIEENSKQNKDSNTKELNSDSKVLDENLCAKNEKIAFGFKVKNSSKRLSICISESQDYIVYRYGTKEKVDLEYPKDAKENSWDKFSYAYYLRGGGKQNCGLDLNHIKFLNDDHLYDIFQDYSAEEDKMEVGITITNTKDQKEARFEGVLNSKIGSLVDFRWDYKVKKVDSWF